MYHCQYLKDHPNSKAPEELAEQVAFFEQFKRQVIGPNLVDCDYAFFPACWENHWILFVVDVQKSKVSIIVSLYSESVGRSYKDMYPSQFYIMEKLLPCMLHHLDSSRFPQPKFMKVRSVTERPKQVGGSDCGVYVVKYVDAICGGIQLKNAVWDPTLDILTFRYRMAWKLNRGRARHISEWGIK
ncbi:putative ubiquitin-like-specific protease 1B [Daucus carota subsp. sativus]|uniref:putative ubiquitin-like-specific protease 1B n=1 Tax=Daucus carota subsp. sativus TaxID=79200 RepID=UPI0030831331